MIVNFKDTDNKISGPFLEQPNAVDVPLDKVFKIEDTEFSIDAQNNKTHRIKTEIIPADGFWVLEPGCYEIETSCAVQIASGYCGYLKTRSTFVRNGCFVQSGLYDSGYSGVVGGILVVNCGNLKIQRGTRIAQFILEECQCSYLYNGSYGNK